MSQILSYSYTHGSEHVSADEIRCAAFFFAKAQEENGVCLLLVDLPSQKEPVQVVANLNAGEASIVLPLPEWEKECSFGHVFSFSGSLYVISEGDISDKTNAAQDVFGVKQPLYLFSLDRISASITGMQFFPDNQKWSPAVRSAEAAASAALVLHRDLQNGTMESTIDQPQGLLEIGLRKENGRVLGLSAGGPVEVRE